MEETAGTPAAREQEAQPELSRPGRRSNYELARLRTRTRSPANDRRERSATTSGDVMAMWQRIRATQPATQSMSFGRIAPDEFPPVIFCAYQSGNGRWANRDYYRFDRNWHLNRKLGKSRHAQLFAA